MHDRLFAPIRIGKLELPHRILMAPMTRSRARQPGDVPWELNAEYYRQRASAGLIITEATWVDLGGKGYAFVPGIVTDEQSAGWRRVTDTVHEAGGKIVLQLFHAGRIGHTALQPGGGDPIAPSAIRAKSMTYIDSESGMVEVSEPRALRRDEIPSLVDAYRRAALNAQAAGFDGVEIHGANGYLLDEFLRDGSNRRSDDYGGSIEQRARLCVEVTEAVVAVFGPGRVGYRVSPLGAFNDMTDSDPQATFGHLAERLGALGLAYIHVIEDAGDGSGRGRSAEPVLEAIRQRFKTAGGGAYVANHAYTPELAHERIDGGLADAVAFGKLFLSNPDLPERIRSNGPYNEPDPSSFYGGDERGYTDYPTRS